MSWGSPRHRLRISPVLGAISAILFLTAGSIAGVVSPAAAQPNQHARLITFKDSGHAGLGARIASRADANRLLAGTPKGFRRYVGAEGRAAATHTTTCDAADAAVHVVAYTTSHFAAGAGSPCGGRWDNTRVIVGKRHHHWTVLIATQDAWDCRLLRRYDVPGRLIKVAPAPADATHNCFDYTTQEPGHYHPHH
jgi:hypothetical protein